ncbi:hypothetical protein DC094_10930 [Pelagibaculum spongiae]|uniref:Uncharacterized protein n=1 Tax=Pelagibaculum spongiae TaxID=2080658 RepID=A0A2V1GWZ1_9GAMM|nr:hypothetical protein DC094_10930 [Pelagibaculum spongiae]
MSGRSSAMASARQLACEMGSALNFKWFCVLANQKHRSLKNNCHLDVCLYLMSLNQEFLELNAI